MFKVPEQYRISEKHHKALGTDESFGNNGAFQIPIHRKSIAAFVIASDGGGWDHVSVHISDKKGNIRTPTWNEMNKIKELFWTDEETVIQLHPPKSTYISQHPNTLHLWNSHMQEVMLPDPEMVGSYDYLKNKKKVSGELKNG